MVEIVSGRAYIYGSEDTRLGRMEKSHQEMQKWGVQKMKTKGRDGRTEVERAADKGHSDSDESCSRMQERLNCQPLYHLSLCFGSKRLQMNILLLLNLNLLAVCQTVYICISKVFLSLHLCTELDRESCVLCYACGWKLVLISQSAVRNNLILVEALATASSSLATIVSCSAKTVALQVNMEISHNWESLEEKTTRGMCTVSHDQGIKGFIILYVKKVVSLLWKFFYEEFWSWNQSTPSFRTLVCSL